MAVELASAYVSLLPSFAGVKARLDEGLGGPAKQAGDHAGEQAGKAFGQQFGDRAKDLATKELGGLDSVAKREGDRAGTSFGRSFGDKAKDLAGKGGLAASAALAVGFAKDLSIDAGNDKLAAQLGLTAAESGRAGKLAADLYKGAYGDSLGQVNEAIAFVSKNISSLGTTSTADMERLSAKTLGLATAFDQDLGGATAAVGDLVKTGLAKNADEAFDIITVGFQGGADKAGDFLDTITEYGVQFKQLGLSGATATGLITQALGAGARDSDFVADALKEFTNLAVTGSEETSAAYASLGLNQKQVVDDITAGGPRAAAALDVTLDRLRGMTNQTEQATAATAIFGPQAENLRSALLALDPSTAAAGLGQLAGAADRVNTTLGDNTNTRLEMFKRTLELATASVGDFVGPIGAAAPAIGGLVVGIEGAGGAASKIGGLFTGAKDGVTSLASGMGSAAKASGDFARTQGAAAVASARTTATLVAQKAVTLAQAAATKVAAIAQAAFNLVMSLNPVVLIVLAVVAFIAVLVLAYTKVEWFRNFVDGAFRLILGVVQAVVGWVRANWPLLLAILAGPIGLAVLFIVQNFDKIKAAFGAVKDFIFNAVGAIVGFIFGIPGRIARVVSSMWDGIKGAFIVVKNFVADRIGDYVGFVTNIRDKIGQVARGMFDSIGNAFRGVINWIIGAWNRLDFGIHIRIPDFIPGVGGKGFDVDDIFPDVPTLGGGGIVPATRGGRIVRVSEAGRDEGIVPLPRGGLAALGAGRGVGDIHVTMPQADPLTVARSIFNEAEWRMKTDGR